MTKNETSEYHTCERVSAFGKAHSDLFPPDTVGGKAFAVVAANVEQLGNHAVEKMASHGAALEGGETRKTLREELRMQLMAISQTARVMAKSTPELDGMFRMPSPRTDQALITAARVFHRDAEALVASFVAHALPATFLGDLDMVAGKFEQTILTREAGRDDHTAARASIEAALAAALSAVHDLDAIVANRLHDDPVTMAVWERDRRIERPARAKKGSVAVTVTPASTAAAAQAPRDANPESTSR